MFAKDRQDAPNHKADTTFLLSAEPWRIMIKIVSLSCVA